MMQTLNKTLMAMALAAALPTAAQAADVPLLDVVFDPTAVSGYAGPGAAFTFDEIVISSVGSSTLSVTDSGDGVIDGSFTDTFTEAGLVTNANFKYDGSLILPGTSGVNVNYQMYAVFDPTLIAGTGLAGWSGLVGPAFVGIFDPTKTAAAIVLDTTLDSAYTPGSSTIIGWLTMGTGNCVLTGVIAGTYAEGSCGMQFAFDAGGVTDAGVWTRGGIDIGTLGLSMQLDIDVDDIAPPFTLAFPGGAGSTQTGKVIHDGSTAFVPEPATLGLLGIGLLGMGSLLRRRAA